MSLGFIGSWTATNGRSTAWATRRNTTKGGKSQVDTRPKSFAVSVSKPRPECTYLIHSISCATAFPSICLFLAYIALYANAASHPFAVFTNTCYVSISLHRLVDIFYQRPVPYFMISNLAVSSFIYVFLGSSSFGFHLTKKLDVPLHSFDIIAGLFLVTHIFYTVFTTTVFWVTTVTLGSRRSLSALGLFTSSLLYLVIVFWLVVDYEYAYKNQSSIYLLFGILTACLYLPLRVKLTGGAMKARSSLCTAMLESMLTLFLVLSAVDAQCELLGSKCREEDRYDFYHGQWHFMIATSTSIVYARAVQASRLIADENSVSVCNMTVLDYMCMALLFLYACMVMIFKETKSDLAISRGTLAFVASCLFIHALVFLARRYVLRYPSAKTPPLPLPLTRRRVHGARTPPAR